MIFNQLMANLTDLFHARDKPQPNGITETKMPHQRLVAKKRLHFLQFGNPAGDDPVLFEVCEPEELSSLANDAVHIVDQSAGHVVGQGTFLVLLPERALLRLVKGGFKGRSETQCVEERLRCLVGRKMNMPSPQRYDPNPPEYDLSPKI